MASARAGDLGTRVGAQTAYRSYLLRETLLSIGVGARHRDGVGALASVDENEVEMTVEEEAGARLEAEVANDLSLLRRYAEADRKG